MRTDKWILTVASLLSVPAMAGGFSLKSKSFKNEGDIPAKFTCEGENISPQLSWTGTPSATKSIALIVDDPDAPDPAKPEKVVTHWVIYNLPKSVRALGEGITAFPAGTLQGLNEEKETKYMGPCPPIGKHHYHFKVFALDINPHFFAKPTKEDLEKAMAGHVLAQSELIGLYAKGERK